MKACYLANPHWPLAIHEAAHGVVGVVLGLSVPAIDIDFDHWSGGADFKESFAPEEWRRHLLVCLAGEEAQRRVDPAGLSLVDVRGNCRASDDMNKAWQAASSFNSREDSYEEDRIAEERIQKGRETITELVDMLWPHIEVIAKAIIDRAGTLSPALFDRTIGDSLSTDERDEVVRGIAFVHLHHAAP